MTALPVVAGVKFAPIAGLDGYAVGDDGSVWSSHQAAGRFANEWRPVSIYRRPYGARYCVVSLRADAGRGKVVCRYVHRLVLEAFVGPCPDGHEVLHGDRDTANNCATNLRWGTHAENVADMDRHGTRVVGSRHRHAKLTEDKVREIRRIGRRLSQTEIGREYGVSQTVVGKVLRRETWRHV